MRKIIIAFGLLDALLASRLLLTDHYFQFSQPGFGSLVLNFTRAAFLLSLPFSAYGLFRFRRWAMMLSYIQFPFRFAFATFTFWFVARVDGGLSAQLWFIVLAALEFTRLGLTIAAHARFVSKRGSSVTLAAT